MNETIYIKATDCTEVEYPGVILSDFLTVYCMDKKIENEIKNMNFYRFDKQGQIVVSILKVIELLQNKYPSYHINNLGEEDFIVEYKVTSKNEKLKESLSTFFISFVAFFGGGYAIMAYNTDLGAKELFTYISMLFIGNARQGVLVLSICYTIGLAIGMVIFFNHIGNRRLSNEPTPLEIQMRLYENDITTTVIKDMSRRKENIET